MRRIIFRKTTLSLCHVRTDIWARVTFMIWSLEKMTTVHPYGIVLSVLMYATLVAETDDDPARAMEMREALRYVSSHGCSEDIQSAGRRNELPPPYDARSRVGTAD